MKKTVFKRILAALPMLVMMVVIFGFSGEDGENSGSLSLRIARWVTENFGVGKDYIEVLHLLIRKCAHMTEYGVLYLTCILALYGVRYNAYMGLALSFVYACTDELHQSFIPGRCGTYKDVLIDMCGAMVVYLLYKILSSVIKRRRAYNKQKPEG